MYRERPSDRLYVCPSCLDAAWGSLGGGPVTCDRCRATTTLPERGFVLAPRGPAPMPSNDPARLGALRAQAGRPRTTPPTLAAVLGGSVVQPGREAEAIAIWQNLRSRSEAGDVSASEDLTALTALLVELESMARTPTRVVALTESALDVVVLPRHRQEQLGRLVRLAVADGERPRAGALLAAMTVDPPELEADSDHRVAYALVAALDRDGRRILELLGSSKDAVPIADSHVSMACVLRAHGYELVSQQARAAQALSELSSPSVLRSMQARYATLALCARTAPDYFVQANEEAAERAARAAGGVGAFVGGTLAFVGLLLAVMGVLSSATHEAGFTGDNLVGTVITLVVGVPLFLGGLFVFFTTSARAERARRVRLHGLSLPARILNASPTGAEVNDVPEMRFTLQVAGPAGAYEAAIEQVVPPHEVAGLIGREVRVRADPERLEDVVLED